MDAFGDTLAKAAGWPSEFGELGVSIAASRSHRRGPRWQAEGVENLSGYDRILEALRPSDVLDPEKDILALGIANVIGFQLPGEPFMARSHRPESASETTFECVRGSSRVEDP